MNIRKIILPVLATILLSAHFLRAETGIGQNLGLTVGAQIDEELFVGIRAGGYFGKHMEQIDQVQSEFDGTGASGTELAVTGRLFLGRIGKAAITGIGDLAIYNRGISDSSLYDSVITPGKFTQYLPRAGINLHVPFAGGFAVEMNNLFERRLITKPGPYTFWVWRPQMRILSPALTPLLAAAFLDYEGFDHKDLRYMGSISYGLKARPMASLAFELSDRIFWKPEEKDSRIHVLTLNLEYSFNLAGKD